MKNTSLIIGLAFIASITQAQVASEVDSQTITIKAVLPSEVNESLMAQAKIKRGVITVQGDTAVIRGQAEIVVPKDTIGQIVQLPEGVDGTNFIRGSFTLGTNGTTVIAEFKK